MKQRSISRQVKNHIELFPASVLLQRRPWEAISLPRGSYLLVINKQNETLLNSYRKVTAFLRHRGYQVFFWTPTGQP